MAQGRTFAFATGRRTILGRAAPAVIGEVADDAVGILVFDFVKDVAFDRHFAHVVFAAGLLDLLARIDDVVDPDADVMQADELAATIAGGFVGLVVQQRQRHGAVAQIDAARQRRIGLAYLLEAESLLIKLGRFPGIGNGDSDVTQFVSHGAASSLYE